jgi:para-nitrobenzyl esterase
MFAHGLRNSGLIRRITLSLAFGVLITGLSLIASPSTLTQKSEGPIVTVSGGKVQGRLLPAPGGAVFKGIPYAAPPVGDLRWREPQPVKLWTGVRQAAEYGADCIPNHAEGTTRIPPNHSDATGATSEDCLFVNVWTPTWPTGAKTPVMIWLHGGELFGGTGALHSGPAEHAESSLARHGVVLVSINYRPHLLGMMAHPELTAESPHRASGNYVILDAIAALQWVHDNIARFGGDPGNVTVFGQSGGATITSYLVTSPLTKGLITRAIIESGAPAQVSRPPLSEQQLEQIGVKAAELLKAPSTDAIKYLRGLPASEIAAASKALWKSNVRFGEGIDGYAVLQAPPEVFRSHEEPRVPMIIGSTAQDSNQIEGVSPLNPNASPEETRAWVENAVQVFYGQYQDLLERAQKIYGLRGGPNEVSSYPPYGAVAYQLGVDLHHRCAVLTTASWHSTIAPTYVYEFTREIPSYPPVHESELRFVFGFLSTDEVADESAHKLADAMQTYWTNFAKTGNPNGPGLPLWPQYNATTKQAIDFTNDGPVQRNEYRAVACAPYIDKTNRTPKLLSTK